MADYFSDSVALKLKPFRASAAAILKELASKEVLEEDFLVDPAGFLVQRLHGPVAERLPRRQLNAANRFMFALLSNPKFRGWIAEYQEKMLKEYDADPTMVIDREKIRGDFAKAILQFGDKEIVGAILPGNLRAQLNERPWDLPGRLADTVVFIETAAAVILFVAVVVVVVGVVAAGEPARVADRAMLKGVAIDIRAIGQITEAIVLKGEQLRQQNRL